MKDEEDMVYTCNGILLLSHKKNESMPFAATWMDLEFVILSDTNQKKEDKHCMITLTWAI